MKVAIIGTSIDFTDNEERDVRQLIASVIKSLPIDTEIISGGAKGVDSIAIEVGNGLGYSTTVFFPTIKNWDGFRERNIKVAKHCDELFCVTIPTRKQKCYHHPHEEDHEKTAGCWTLRKAKELGKECKLLVTVSR